MRLHTLVSAAALISALTPVISTAQVRAVVTADNSYMLGYGSGSTATWQPVVENTSPTAIFTCGPGPEIYSNLNPGVGDYIYIVAFSDKGGTQGVLGQFTLTSGGRTVLTGDPGWQVYPTGVDANTGWAAITGQPEVPPATANAQIAIANAGNLWQGVVATSAPGLVVGEDNSQTPGGDFQPTCVTPPGGIAVNARWMWYRSVAGMNPFTHNPPKGGHKEFLIFRIPVRALMCTCPRPNPHDASEASGRVAPHGLNIRAEPADTPTARPRPAPRP